MGPGKPLGMEPNTAYRLAIGRGVHLTPYIDGELDKPSDFERLSGEMELSIFGVLQECPPNIHRQPEVSQPGFVLRKTKLV
jgi:hypothetical protein